MVRLLVSISLASLLVETSPQSRADDWPLFRGNVLQTGVATSRLPEKLSERWTFKAKEGIEGSPAIVGGLVFIGSYDHFYAIDLKSGQEKWKYKAAAFKTAPAVRNGLVYVGDEDGGFHCLDAKTGAKKWTFKIDNEITSGAAFSGDDVLFGAGDEHLYCLDKDGKKRWMFQVAGGPVIGTPTIVEGKTFVAGCDSALHVISTKDGKEDRTIALAGQVGATSAANGDRVFLGTMTNEVQAIDWKKEKVAWTYRAEKSQQPFSSSVALTEKYVVVGSKDRRVHCINRTTGEEVWTFLTGGRVDSSPVIVGKRVYVGSLDGKFYVLDLDKGTLVQAMQLDGDIMGSPAVAGGCLVVGTIKGTVYCLGGE